MFLITLASLATANPVQRGVQAQIHPAGFELVSTELSGLDFQIGPTEIAGSWECYSSIVVDGFNLDIQLERVTLEPRDGSLGIDVQLGSVRGEQMGISGVSGWFDLCLDFDTTVEYITLNDGHLQGSLASEVRDGVLELSFSDPPIFTGEFSSEISWFPDSLVWAFMEDSVLQMVSDLLEDTLPGIVSDFTSDELLLGTWGTATELSIDVAEVSTSTDGLYVAVDLDLNGDGGPTGTRLDLDPRGSSHLAVGVTGAMAAELLEVAWAEGLLAADSPALTALLDDLIEVLGLGDDVQISLSTGVPPSISIDNSGLHVAAPSTQLVATSGGEVLLELAGDLAGDLEVDIAYGAIRFSAHDLSLDVTHMDASHLIEEDPDTLQDFLEGWVMAAATAALADLEVYGSHFEALGYVLRLDETQTQADGIAAWVTIFDADDPAVDRIPPDTIVEAMVSGSSIRASFAATDDRPGELMFSWRLDDDSWSGWSLEDEIALEAEPGDHRIEVISRDLWHNQDPSPAVATLSVEEPAVEEPNKKCGCGTPSPTSPIGLLGVALLLLRRRTIQGRR